MRAHQILAARAAAPSEFYGAFMQRLTAAVRDDIADCAAASYPSLGVDAAQRMFKFDSPAELAEYMRAKRVRAITPL